MLKCGPESSQEIEEIIGFLEDVALDCAMGTSEPFWGIVDSRQGV